MKRVLGFFIMAGLLLTSATGFAQRGDEQGQGRAVVTVLPEHGNDSAAQISMQYVTVKVNGKDASVTGLTPLRGADDRMELVVLIDGAARTSLGEQFGSIRDFVKEMPANTKVAIAYMEEGRAVFSGPFSSDPAQVVKGLQLTAGPPGASASPYFCLSDLAKRWPSQDNAARRVVVMITNGVDNYDMRYNPDDPYVQAAMTDAVRSGLVVYSIFWRSEGRAENTGAETNAGQSLLTEVTDATGGHTYLEGFGNPVSFDPFFKDLRIRLRNQYALTFTTTVGGKSEVERLQVKASVAGAKIEAPQQVWVNRAEISQR